MRRQLTCDQSRSVVIEHRYSEQHVAQQIVYDHICGIYPLRLEVRPPSRPHSNAVARTCPYLRKHNCVELRIVRDSVTVACTNEKSVVKGRTAVRTNS
jgi:hypothetical protein